MIRRSEKEINFKRISEKKVAKVIEDIHDLRKLTNSNYYEFSSDEIDQIFREINQAIFRERINFFRVTHRDDEAKKFMQKNGLMFDDNGEIVPLPEEEKKKTLFDRFKK